MEVLAVTRALVEEFEVRDERTAEFRERTLKLLVSVSDPFSRDAQLDHVTASAVVMSTRGTVVMHKHKRLGLWIGPGGHVDPGESPVQSVIREVAEETGLYADHLDGGPALVDIDIHELPDGHVHYDLRFLLASPPDEPSPAEGESQEVAWFASDEAVALTDASFGFAVEAALKWPNGRKP